ncbi:type VII secretion target [Gordonia sp. ABSL11-1]|uniref:type VII secretion target n=1 Tax=Gordonia sp. ABSL11-1 TaxID=3053924 RepID=UPI0025747CAE|nr:type VII secretion target [Gordonia sp. ABSL11-1]MDL9947995.1 type VII secretion target [Gordonia sp. ABSL11-1]
MTDRITIDPASVRATGSRVDAEAGEARAALTGLFDSARPAADGNPGFATGPHLTAFARSLRSELETTIDDLSDTAHNVVNGAKTIERTDGDTAEGLSRLVTALNGLGHQPLPG